MNSFVAGEADNNHVFWFTQNDDRFITINLVYKNYIENPMNFIKTNIDILT